ncbi:aldehyde dehydrogenase family protein [Paenibacillus sp. Z3-2]
MENINPYTGEVIARWRSSNKKDIDNAYESAQENSIEWAKSLLYLRMSNLNKILCSRNCLVQWL